MFLVQSESLDTSNVTHQLWHSTPPTEYFDSIAISMCILILRHPLITGADPTHSVFGFFLF